MSAGRSKPVQEWGLSLWSMRSHPWCTVRSVAVCGDRQELPRYRSFLGSRPLISFLLHPSEAVNKSSQPSCEAGLRHMPGAMRAPFEWTFLWHHAWIAVTEPYYLNHFMLFTQSIRCTDAHLPAWHLDSVFLPARNQHFSPTALHVLPPAFTSPCPPSSPATT